MVATDASFAVCFLLVASLTHFSDGSKTEYLDIESIDAVNGTVTLAAPVQYEHWGQRYAVNEQTGEIRILAQGEMPLTGERLASEQTEIALMDRNIEFSTTQQSVGNAHALWMMGATGYTKYAEYDRMGPADKMGRYAIHWHRVGGSGNDKQAIGNVVWNSSGSANNPINKGIVIQVPKTPIWVFDLRDIVGILVHSVLLGSTLL